MTAETCLCPDCGAEYAHDDNYCRQCGMYVAALRTVPVSVPPRDGAVEASRPGLPQPVRKAAAAIAIGTALQVGVGLAGRYLARQAARQAVSAVRPRPRAAKSEPAPARAVEDAAVGASAISETLLIRRVWVRRD